MKLTYFSEQTTPKMTPGRYSSVPRFSFSKAGAICLNNEAMKLIGIKAKDKISLAQDPDNPANWYIFKDKEHGFEVRAGYKDRGGMVSHRALCNMILECFGLPRDQGYNFKIGGKPTEFGKVQYWGILITAPISE